MQYSKVLNFSGYKKILEFAKNNIWLIVTTLFFIIGFSIAVFSYKSNSYFEEFSRDYISNFINLRNTCNFLKIVKESFLNSMLFIVLSFICGSSFLGVLLVPMTVALKGFLYGSVTSLLYCEYTLKGIAFHAVILMPSSILLIVALIFASVESVKFSVIILKLTLPRTLPLNLSLDFKRLCYKYLLFSALVLFSAFIDALITYNFLTGFHL